jgi:hypothetical protein
MAERETLHQFLLRFPGFENWRTPKQLTVIAYYIHTVQKREEFSEAEMRYFVRLIDKDLSPEQLPTPHILKTRRPRFYKLQWRTHKRLDKQLSLSPTFKQIDQLLKDLPTKIPITEEKEYLIETLKCHSCGANRAAIVMCWNLTFYHLCNFIFTNPSNLATFNQELPRRFPKATLITVFDDFSRLKESDILDLCNQAKLMSPNQYKILKEQLNRRHMAAHPSTVVITSIDAQHYILDLINNVVLRLGVTP